MKFARRYTQAGKDPFANIPFATRTSKITNPDGSIVFEAPAVNVPSTWSQVATDVLAQKYFLSLQQKVIVANLLFLNEDFQYAYDLHLGVMPTALK